MGYLTNAIKALFTRNTTNAASVSGARVAIVEQNGNPIGNDSMANLASVLGERQFKGTLNPTSASSIKDFDGILNGWYIFFDEDNTLSHNPLGASSFGVVFQQYLGTSSRIQFAYVATYESPRKYYIASRIGSIESGGWNTWRYVEISN